MALRRTRVYFWCVGVSQLVGVARAFLEAAGMGGVDRPDLEVLARRWGREFAPAYPGSQPSIRLDGVIWLDAERCLRGECRQHCAEELAQIALEIYGFPLTEAAIQEVAALFFGPVAPADSVAATG
jgi:hypothetical protein